MIGCSGGSLHDIDHFLKVYALATSPRPSASERGWTGRHRRLWRRSLSFTISPAPSAGSGRGTPTAGVRSGRTSLLAAAFLEGSGWPQARIDRVVYPVGYHQILLEADHLVNAGESGYPEEAVRRMREVLFHTPTGTALLDQIDLAR